MEPAEAITALEVALREVIRLVLGDQWPDRSGLNVPELESRREEERKSRDGAIVEDELLAYTHIFELRKVIDKNWEAFKPVFGDKKRFDVYMDRVEDFRNAPMHSRTLLPFERDLLSGIVGEFRNLATMARSKQGPDKQFYPIIESIVDSHGVNADVGASVTMTGLRLQVGEVVQFSCRGWDPQGRDLHWELCRSPSGSGKMDEAVGSEVVLTWRVSKSHVGEQAVATVMLRSTGEFHRHGYVDQTHMMAYAVNPPTT